MVTQYRVPFALLLNNKIFRTVFFYIFLTVHLRIILVGDQPEAQILLYYVYLNHSGLVIIPEVVLTLRRLMSYIYGAPILDVSRSHTTTQHSR